MEKTFKVIPFPSFTFEPAETILARLQGEEKDFPRLKGFSSLPEKLEDYKHEIERIQQVQETLENVLKGEPLAEVFCTEEGENKIRINYTPECRAHDIRQYLLPVSGLYHYLPNESIEIISNIWKLAVENDIIFNIYHGKEWDPFSRKESECPYSILWPELRKWKQKCPHFNHFTIVNILRKFYKYGTNYLVAINLLAKKLNDLADFLRMTKGRIKETINQINFGIEFETSLQHKDGLKTIVEEVKCGDFSFIQDPLSRVCLVSMLDAIRDTPGSINWFISDGNMFSKSPILQKLSSHKAVEDCGHSGMSMSWTLTQFKYIFTKGWEYWVLSMLSYNGVGWDYISLEQAVEFGNVECTMYILDKLGSAEKQNSLNFAVTKAIETDKDEIVSAVLKDFDSHFTEEEYDDWKNFKCQNHQKKISKLLTWHCKNAASSSCKSQPEISGALF